ncbi:glutaredoxin [Haloarcula sp. S1CR25-12]|uniref:Glutaredoxin n=1 Tax=Haloarcula saliterrae TaxID=2950534 RepID=A0ABU2FBK1_9EURY|nr:glutaredoxin domain-containing protein [Haloarcula sp. S1CR25-12]MDS0259293.1 glutaredoxin [Haloarcula sp. S1CR25-12]
MSFEPRELSPEEARSNVEETIENSEVALFMKGTEMMPQCGYSRKALGLIGQHREDVTTVNVLTATEAYREALAEYSGRETIPQTFVDGEFVGGSDILEQLDDNGDLAETLQV